MRADPLIHLLIHDQVEPAAPVVLDGLPVWANAGQVVECGGVVPNAKGDFPVVGPEPREPRDAEPMEGRLVGDDRPVEEHGRAPMQTARDVGKALSVIH